MSDRVIVHAPKCPYCGGGSHLDDGCSVYGHSQFGPVWVCDAYPKCDAYVGAHPSHNYYKPKGTLANKSLRKIRMQAHAAFDPIWKEKKNKIRRIQAYRWLSKKIGVDFDKCHIAMFNAEQCKLVIEVCLNRTTLHDKPPLDAATEDAP